MSQQQGFTGGNNGNGGDSMGSEAISSSVGFDRLMARAAGRSVRYLVATVKARPAINVSPRKPINLALVIDRSGSMAGQKILSARDSARAVVERLREDDRVSVVSFDNIVDVLVRGVPVSPESRDEALRQIDTLDARGGTDLSSGWLEGAEVAASAAVASPPGTMSHLVVLSDGQANQGVVDPVELQRIAAGLRDRGLTTSAVGIGDDYSTVQLEAISEGGGGRIHEAETPDQIAEVVLGELGDLGQTVAEGVRLTVRGPAGIEMELVGTVPARTDRAAGLLEVGLGKLPAGAVRHVVVRVTLPAGRIGEELPFSVTLKYQDVATEREVSRQFGGEALTIALTSDAENERQPREIDRSQRVASAWQAFDVRRAVTLNRDHDFAGAKTYLREQLKHFDRYCRGLPDGEELIKEMRRVLGAIDFEWDERSRKSMSLACVQKIGTRDDLRESVRLAPMVFSRLVPERPSKSQPKRKPSK